MSTICTNEELSNKLVARWNAPNGRPLSGKLIDSKKSPSEPDCMCAQGWTLYESGMSTDDILNLEQSEADREVSKRLGISRAHAVLLRIINDSLPGSPSIVLTNPSAVLGAQADTVLKFWLHLDGMSNYEWNKLTVAAGESAGASALEAARAAAGVSAWAAAWAAARAAARAAAWEAAWEAAGESAGESAGVSAVSAARASAAATNEIQGASLMREKNTPFFFLPLFGFAGPEFI